MARKLFSRELDEILPNWLTDEQKERCYCDDRGWVLVHPDGSEEVIVAGSRYNNPAERGHGFDAQRRSKDPDRAAAHGELSYTLIPSKTTVGEGESVSVQLVTTGVQDETLIAYTIEGIDPEDLDNGLLAGEFQIFENTATIEIPIKADSLTEGLETFTLKLADDLASIQIDIEDLSKTPIYTLSSNPVGSVDEGSPLEIILTTENLPDPNISIGYSIEGVDGLDLDAGSELVGNIQLSDGVGSVTLNIKADQSTEELPEKLILRLNDNLGTIEVDINDTSKTPIYTLSSNPVGSVDEGSPLEIILTTENLPDPNISIGYSVSGEIGPEDLDAGSAPLVGNIQLSDGVGSVIFNIKSDALTEELPETLKLTLDGGLGEIVVSINDTSKTPVFILSTEGGITEINEGEQLIINFSTINVANDTQIAYEFSGSADLNNDFVQPVSKTGNFVVGSQEQIILDVKQDFSFEEGDKTIRLTLTGLDESVFVIIRDSSKLAEDYTLSTLNVTTNTSDVTEINEGETLRISLATNIPSGTSVPYTISGIDQADLSSGSLSGNFVVGTTDSIDLTFAEDLSFEEGNETLTLTLDGLGESVSVNIVDTSIADPVYSLSSLASVDEGQDLTISLSTQYVSNGTNIPYTITGISQADLSAGSLTGNFTVGSVESVTLSIAEDLSFEEGNETLTLTLDGLGESVDVIVNDTSTATSAYFLSTVGDVTFVNEGDSLTISLSTQYVSNGTVIPYTLGGTVNLAEDFDSALNSSGQFVVGSNESVTFNLKNDLSFEEGDETLTLSLDGLNTSISILVKDTSRATEVYSLSAPTSANEGDSLTISLSTQYVSAGTVVDYTLGGTVNLAEDFDSALNSTGQFVVGSNDSVTFNLKNDLSFEEGNETFTLTLDGLGESVSVNIVDTSIADPVYSLSSSLAEVNEGQDLTISLSTQYVSAGTSVPYTITGISQADLSAGSLTGNFVVGTVDSITLGISSDASFEEGDETLTLTLDGLGESVSVNIVDSSVADPVYSLSAPVSVDEGDSVTISLTTQYVSAGTQVPYQITGISQADLSAGSITGNFVVGTTDSITVTIAEDLSDNEGNETLRLTLLTGTGDFVDVVINDTSKAPVYNLSSSPIGNVDEGNPLVITLNAVNVEPNTTIGYNVTGISSADLDTGSAALSGGLLLTGADSSSVSGSLTFNIKADALTEPTPESLILTLDGNVASISVEINDTSQTPFYTLSSSHPAGIDEGQDLTISLATNVDSGTVIPYQITGIQAEDLSSGSLSGNFVVGTTDSITLGIASDVTSGEGDETLRLTLTDQNQFIEVTINDTSTTAPSSNELITYEGATLYRSGISGDGQYAAWNAPFYDFHIFKKNGSTWEYSTTITPPDNSSTAKLAYRVQRSVNFSYDGSVLLAHNPQSGLGLNNGQTWIYRRQPDGSYNLDQTIGTNGTSSNYWAYVTAVSDDGNTIALLDYDNKITYIYQYNGTSFVQFTTVSHPRSVAIELSSDGSSLYVAGAYWGNSPYWVSKYSLNNGSYTLEVDQAFLDTSFTSPGLTDISISNNEKLMIVEKYFDGNGQIIDIFDYDDNTSTWVRRLESIHEPSLTGYENAFGQICMSDPDSNGVVTITNHGGRTYYLPGSLNTYLQASQSVNEGEELVVKLFTALDGPSSGTYAYTISGITADDLDTTGSYAGMTGSFNVSDGVGSITLKLKEDVSYEEGLENLIISLDDGTDSITVRVNDTSILDPTPSENGLIEYNSESLGYSAISGDGQYLAYSSASAIHVFEKNGSSWIHSTSIDDLINPTFLTPIDMNYDGSLLIISSYEPFLAKIYRRQGDGTYTQEAYFSGVKQYGFCSAISNDGNTVVVSNSNTSSRIHTYKYVDGSWNQFDDSLIIPIFIPNVELSNDGSNLYMAAPYHSGTPLGAHYYYKYNWNGSSWTQIENQKPLNTNFSGGITGMSISNNENLLIVSSQSINGAAQTINIFDYDSDNNTWVRRDDDITVPSGITYPNGQGIDLSDPDSNGIATLTNYGGRTYQLPGTLP